MTINPAQTSRVETSHSQTARTTQTARKAQTTRTAQTAQAKVSADSYKPAATDRVKQMIANIENRAQQSAPTAPAYTRSNSSQNRLQAKLAEFKTACEASKETPSKAAHTQTDVSKMVKTLDADAARSPDVIISDQAKQKEENDKLEKDAAEFWAQNS